MVKKTKKPARRAPKAAPLTIGGAKGSAAADTLARIEEDLVAAIADAEAALKQLRQRLEELRAERAAAPRETLPLAGARGPTRIDKD